MAASIKDTSSLRALSVNAKKTNITDNGVKILFSSLTDKPNLKKLQFDFSYCKNLTTLSPLSKLVATLTKLEFLEFDTCSTSANDPNDLFAFFPTLPNSLKTLQAKFLNTRSIKLNNKSMSLLFSDNKVIKSDEFVLLAKGIQLFKTLTTLDINFARSPNVNSKVIDTLG